MAMYRIKSWREFQHYKDRNPPWIKLHFSLLSSDDWVTLGDSSRVLAIACMLIGSKNDGMIDGSERGLEYIRRVAYLKKRPDIKPLISCGFLELDSECTQALADARPETETYKQETEGETEGETEKSAYGEFKRVMLTDEEREKLTVRFGEAGAEVRITDLDVALQSKAAYRKKYTDHYATILSWDRRNGGSAGHSKEQSKLDSMRQHLAEAFPDAT